MNIINEAINFCKVRFLVDGEEGNADYYQNLGLLMEFIGEAGLQSKTKRINGTPGAPRIATTQDILRVLGAQQMTVCAWRDACVKELGISPRTFFSLKAEALVNRLFVQRQNGREWHCENIQKISTCCASGDFSNMKETAL